SALETRRPESFCRLQRSRARPLPSQPQGAERGLRGSTFFGLPCSERRVCRSQGVLIIKFFLIANPEDLGQLLGTAFLAQSLNNIGDCLIFAPAYKALRQMGLQALQCLKHCAVPLAGFIGGI